ncbi:glycosyltransferase family 4 protein [Candidatus Chloroploca asiatica]|uniref:Glycosyltransferase subfamily 4-like N-terminal domain-containing protein n=1 Tax=Candidatus Chloroploca asiatica TaxID=1506545 RepID=A0A2H3L534_9CHLR|nr:glycosyltransferase family 4 protein [Candidatus Chloroploca asiatica]PDV99975.1 hypothetical protein A9Q02_11110 [Candidatus Chloroploca asiatica]
MESQHQQLKVDMPTPVTMCVANDMQQDSRVEREASTLAAAGYQVVVLCIRKSPSQPKQEERNGYTISRLDIVSRRLPRHAVFNIVKLLEFLIATFVVALRQQSMIYHAHDLPTLPAMYLAARLRRAKVIYDSHELFTETAYVQFRSMWRLIERFLLHGVDAVIAANIERATVMHEEYGARNLPLTIENCPPLYQGKRTSLLPDYVREQRCSWTQIVLYQGGIIPGRSAETVIRAMRYAPATSGLIFLGRITEEYKEKLLVLAKEQSVADRVLFHRPVPYGKLLAYTSSATVGLVLYENTSRNNYLCAPNKLYEYMMVGLPVVASDFPPLRRVVSTHAVGELVNSTDPADIGRAVTALLISPERMQEIGILSKQVASAHYCWEVESIKLLDLYTHLRQRNV